MSKHEGPYVQRFDLYARISHLCLMLSFLGLSATGLPLLFSHTRWAYWLSRVFGGYAAAAALHRIFAVVLIGTFLVHLARIFHRVIVKRDLGVLWGPRSIVPQPRDAVDLYRHMKFFLGLGPRPRFDRYTYWEKFDYMAVFWGMVIIGGSGLVLWFPTVFSRVLPGWMLNVCEIIHGEEALLAVGFIFTVHFFNCHLRPEKFPMDLVMFTGRMPRAELEDERPAELERLVREGKLDSIAADPPTAELVLVSRVIGGTAVVVGLSLVALIVYAFIRY